NSTFVVVPQENAICGATRLAAAHTGLPDNFETRVGEPTPIVLELSDDCGTPVSGATVTVSFSTRDPEVTLSDTGDGIYAGVWVPVSASNELPMGETLLRARISAPGFPFIESNLTGTVLDNDDFTMLAKDGVLHNAWRRKGGPLAPGMPVEIFGLALAPGVSSPQLENGRLPTSALGVSVFA
ncbi:MAG: hypothetical protein GY953_16975, partial [bacterium]|nr:hypothetical protein [bacterium]